VVRKVSIAIAALAFIACQEKNVAYKHNHRGQQAELSSSERSHIVNWELKIVSGQLLTQTSHADFLAFRDALLNGVFDPNTTLSSTEVDRVGRECTTSPSDVTIGIRRFERTLTLAPDFLTMTDDDGHYLHDWLIALKRPDLLEVERQAQVKLAITNFRK